MALPAIAIAASRIGRTARIAGRALKRGRKIPVIKTGDDRPSILSPEGITMIVVAGMVEATNVLLVILDVALGLGTLLAVVNNGIGVIFIGGWLYFRTGRLPLKKVLLPFGLNSLPLVRFFPFWLWSVWSACKKP